MSAVIAVFQRTDTIVDPARPKQMMLASSERGPDGADIWYDQSILLAHQHFWITPEERDERQPIHAPCHQLTISADARLDNREELSSLLNLARDERVALSDAALILQAYRRWAGGCVEYLRGDFAFIIWDANKKQLFAARDVLGNRDLAYYIDQDICVVASEVTQILEFGIKDADLSEGSIAEWIVGMGGNQHDTLYNNIYYLPPAHYLIVSPDEVNLRRYWDVNPDNRLRYRDDREYSGHYLELLEQVVASRLRTFTPPAVSLSGGLDSTSLAALFAGVMTQAGTLNTRLRTYSYAFDELQECDERRWIHPLVEMYDLDSVEINCDDLWTLRNLREWPLARDYILSDSYPLLPDAVAARAGGDGCRILIAGYYGDTLFGGGYYWAAQILAEMRLDELAKTAISRWKSVDPRLDFFEYGLRPLIPASAKRLYRRSRPRSLGEWQTILHPDFIHRTNLIERKNNGETALQKKFQQVGQFARYKSLFDSSTAQGAAATRRLYNRHGVELEAPYQDRRLVEFVMALPADQLYRPGRDRWVHRNAMQGLLPEVVRERTQQTSFEALFTKGVQREHASIVEIFRNPQVVARKIINSGWLSSQLSNLSPESPGIDQLWLVICLELWLKRYFT